MNKTFKTILALVAGVSATLPASQAVQAQTTASLDSINQAATTDEYVVQWGDTLSTIAQAFGLTVEQLMVINDIEDPDFILAGMKISVDFDEYTITFEEEDQEPVTYSLETGEVIEPASQTLAPSSVNEWTDFAATTPAPAVVNNDQAAPAVEAEAEVVAPAAVSEWTAPVEESVEAVAEPAVQPEPVVAEVTDASPAPSAVEESAAPVNEAPVEVASVEEEAPAETVAPAVEASPAASEAVASPAVEEVAPVEATPAPVVEEAPATSTYTSNVSGAEHAAKEWIAQKESNGDYNAVNPSGKYIGRYQLTDSYLNGDHSPENQERVADDYVAKRYGSWTAAKAFWEANGWY
ncbi:aggregation-promoting factor [Hutsoniella sourekii]|uniref:aggregation-promoting factor n=1 Tax=Hutsoniella sourekii TaxID=87650 RepID=UPI0004B06741|nr:LysM peptidoglycan-binding domain-containing protein [Hutsoniella sourekii]